MKKPKISKLISTNDGYEWQYCSLGGVTRVKIATGEDIKHLGELDRKLWTVLSCPVNGLEFDSRTLQLMDSNHDGKLRIDEVVEAARWITSVITDADLLLDGKDTIALTALSENEEGKSLRASCEAILQELGLPLDTISLKNVADYKAKTDEQYAKDVATVADADIRPYGDNTDAVSTAVAALREKVADYYMRCHLIRFDADCKAAVDVSVERIAAIATGDVAKASDDIATYPLARPNAEGLLMLDNINPVWASHVATIRKYAVANEMPSLSESQWAEIVAKIDAYTDYLEKQANGQVELLSKGHAEALAHYTAADKLLHIYRDFYTLLKNYVFFKDFYQNDASVKAIFQSGRLFIDQRCCDLCMRVDAIDAHAALASASGMFLIYCACTSREKNATQNIVAVLTDGDIDNIEVGKNAIYYDRDGHCWDAVVKKIIDNPISIRQAFWSPYRKFWKWCTDKINKSAAEKEDKAFNDLTTKANAATEDVKAGVAAGPDAEKKKDEKKPTPFDIAKFAGIFAAIGMAVGYIGSALAGITKTIGDNPLNLLILICGIILVISGPSMFIAWSKLRKRNLGPMLNANGWAVNAVILVNVRFGATLTSIAKYPKLVLDDPFADKKMPAWKKWLIVISILIVIAAVVALIIYLMHQQQAAAAQQVADSVAAAKDCISAE
ncbi:MAG: hypothetical protein IJ620_00705 [Bacteroidales bacterium]|nr:hypothetical protein [Bacteroidales bacterium]